MKLILKISFLLAVTALVAVIGCARQQKLNTTDKTLAGYPQNPVFKRIIEAHRKWTAKPKGKDILMATWFVDGRYDVQMFCYVDQRGRVLSLRYVENHAIQNNRRSQLSEKEILLLRAKLKGMPDNASKLPLTHLVILSFSTGDNRVTRLYDRAKLPQSLQEVSQIVSVKISPPDRFRSTRSSLHSSGG